MAPLWPLCLATMHTESLTGVHFAGLPDCSTYNDIKTVCKLCTLPDNWMPFRTDILNRSRHRDSLTGVNWPDFQTDLHTVTAIRLTVVHSAGQLDERQDKLTEPLTTYHSDVYSVNVEVIS